MVLVFLQSVLNSAKLLKSASLLANQLGKTFGITGLVKSETEIEKFREEILLLTNDLNIKCDFLSVEIINTVNIVEICEKIDASFLFLQLQQNNFSTLFQIEWWYQMINHSAGFSPTFLFMFLLISYMLTIDFSFQIYFNPCFTLAKLKSSG